MKSKQRHSGGSYRRMKTMITGHACNVCVNDCKGDYIHCAYFKWKGIQHHAGTGEVEVSAYKDFAKRRKT